ncbi:hypothetical protein ACFCW6_11675 [Streptomyces sp. NPDC056333]|uniref:hypothetical protein n=1 Tax=Streptomyces sp. NPDC056333 TaxID=3345786 RepID=UPI0035D54D91
MPDDTPPALAEFPELSEIAEQPETISDTKQAAPMKATLRLPAKLASIFLNLT